MKNFIKSKYNLFPDKIYKKNNYYFFFSNSYKIYILKTKKDKKELNSLLKLSNYLYNNGFLISTFILNNKGEYYTEKDDKYIILLKSNDSFADSITLNDIAKYNIQYDDIKAINIPYKWEEDVDKIEKEMTEYNKEYPLIRNSINYFIGMCENAIQMIKTVKINNNSISHDISLNNFNKFEFNNPLNLVKSNKMYDMANYIKYNFYNNTLNYDELNIILNSNSFEDIIIFYSILLYQEEYLDMVKLIIMHKKEEKEINIYINRIEDYKKLLKYIKNALHNIYSIGELDWIEK